MSLYLLGFLLAAAARWLADRALVHEALGGGQAAMQALVRRLLPVIRARVSWRARGTGEDVDDLTQQVWVTLLKDGGAQLKAYDPERGAALETYVGLISNRVVGNALQHRRAAIRGGGKVAADSEQVARTSDSGGPGLEQAVAARDELQALLDFLDARLSERQRLVLRLSWVDGYAAPEVARALGVPTQNIYNDQHRIRSEVRAWQASQQPA